MNSKIEDIKESISPDIFTEMFINGKSMDDLFSQVKSGIENLFEYFSTYDVNSDMYSKSIMEHYEIMKKTILGNISVWFDDGFDWMYKNNPDLSAKSKELYDKILIQIFENNEEELIDIVKAIFIWPLNEELELLEEKKKNLTSCLDTLSKNEKLNQDQIEFLKKNEI